MTGRIDDLAQRAALQQRVLRVLALGQVIGGAALAAAVTVGAFVIQDLLGQETPWAGMATATATIGTAFMSQVLARRMTRLGRRPGLQLGYLLAAVGGVVAAVGVETASLFVFVVGLFLFGNGQAANLISRYAATDLAAPDERSRAMSRIVFASTFGAVFGPVLIGPAEAAGEDWFGLHKYSGPWLLGGVLFAFALVNTALRLRPDPLVASGAIGMQTVAHPRVVDSLRTIGGSSAARLALSAMVISQVTMVAVMAMTPVHLKLHGHEGVSQYVVSLHIAGMYAFSPLVGRYADRRGRVRTILIGSIVLVAATVLAALSGDVEQLLFPSLWALGLGWNFGLIGGSSLLIDSVPVDRRVGVQGTADLLMSFCGGLAGFASGFVRRAIGYHLLATAATVAAGALLVLAYTALVGPAPTDEPVADAAGRS
ncbi:MAG: MFS transporter [Ilumatobacteraceae bacterium]